MGVRKAFVVIKNLTHLNMLRNAEYVYQVFKSTALTALRAPTLPLALRMLGLPHFIKTEYKQPDFFELFNIYLARHSIVFESVQCHVFNEPFIPHHDA